MNEGYTEEIAADKAQAKEEKREMRLESMRGMMQKNIDDFLAVMYKNAPADVDEQSAYWTKMRANAAKTSAEAAQVRPTKAQLKETREESMQLARKKPGTALPAQYPGTLAFTPQLLQSGFFGHGNSTRQVFTDFTEVAALGGDVRIEYMGEQLRQDDLRVLLALIRIRAGTEATIQIDFTPRKFCKDVLKWPDSSDSVPKLLASVKRLQAAKGRLYYGAKSPGFALLSFITDALITPGAWTVYLSPLLVPLLTGFHRTFLKADERLSMKDGLSAWLYGVIKADTCFRAFDLDKLRMVSGSTKIQKEFNRSVKEAMEQFKKDGIVVAFSMKPLSMTVCKKVLETAEAA